MQVRTSI